MSPTPSTKSTSSSITVQFFTQSVAEPQISRRVIARSHQQAGIGGYRNIHKPSHIGGPTSRRYQDSGMGKTCHKH
ncbi:hypothetical protein EC988_004994 [Linderina pennispora]|nr:hypothetical protein EC988_004994 [Linderina pennispora]